MTRKANNRIILASALCVPLLAVSLYIFHHLRTDAVFYGCVGLLVLQFLSIVYGVFARIAAQMLPLQVTSIEADTPYARNARLNVGVFKALGIWVDLK